MGLSPTEYIHCKIVNIDDASEEYNGVFELHFGTFANGLNNVGVGAVLYRGKWLQSQMVYEVVNAYTIGDTSPYFIGLYKFVNGEAVSVETEKLKFSSWPNKN